MLAVMAEHESRMILERVKVAVAVRRARGDSFSPTRALILNSGEGAASRRGGKTFETRLIYADPAPIVSHLRECSEPLRAIVKRLEALGSGRRRVATLDPLS